MGISDKIWDALTTVIKMNDKVEQLADVVKRQQQHIEALSLQVVRLETILEVTLALREPTKTASKLLEGKPAK